MKYKTISGHYDTVYSLEQNNRKFIPQNVDYRRTSRNYNCIAAGQETYMDLEDPRYLPEFWARYRELTQLYWEERSIATTLEEIYGKLYEPSFRAFQDKQRPCRRYNGTYLQKIREECHEAAKMKQQTRNAKIRKTAEAIEIVFGIGDMDNTGYANAPTDAYQSELLLKDYCDHLMQSEHVCFVTTKDLETPNWQPPFKNGLIVLNLTVHCDEATQGIHLTCIPYSRGCKRGPEVQAALGRAMTGMVGVMVGNGNTRARTQGATYLHQIIMLPRQRSARKRFNVFCKKR